MGALTGKTSLVTGGSRGIGRAIAERLGREGARVGVHYTANAGAAKQTVAAIEAAGGSAFALQAELGVPGDAEALWSAFDAHADRLDILINNAGIADLGAIADTSPEMYDRIFAINTRAPFFLVRLALDRLRDGGRIVNISTSYTLGNTDPNLIAYAMSKAAIDVFTTTLAKDLGPRGVTVNAVNPGAIDTDLNAWWLRSNDAAREATAARSPLARVGMPDDVAGVVAFLASDDARWITGQRIDATGGALL
ncbi:SDR family oxidoreductase [Nonomuraea sp. NBC_01738]|uniref:SDR family oxidoreductase n=1 Tax=Nonomuraea sp. NBC_01738 TaxID=2976003 RepID=UPI002E0D1EB4|nr:SDR family oxidoreductase [Nonomuraea sp. NBC_01738]